MASTNDGIPSPATRRYAVAYKRGYMNHGMASMGSSLASYVYLAEQRGYRLVGCMKQGFNAFFVKEDAVPGGLDRLFGSEAYNPEGCYGEKERGVGGGGQGTSFLVGRLTQSLAAAGHVTPAWRQALQRRKAEATQQFKGIWVDPKTMKPLTTASAEWGARMSA